jgi:NADH-quinone oxidoreductase subunit L
VSLETYGWLVLAFPLAGCVLIALTYKLALGRLHGVIGTLAIALSFAASIGALNELDERQVVSMLIHLWSVAYMGGDHGYARFFAYLNFFVFSMLLLVEAANFFMLIIGWAFVGAASYFLISFWYRRTTATAAGIKAFVINVAGDVGLVLGAFFIFRGTGTLDFLRAFEEVGNAFTRNDGDLVAGCILLLVGAFAKSAQVPLHTWLPDAMEGPTPVSALIHAATMVTAGVYLIARMHPLFEQAPIAADVGAIIGCLTLLVAASIGLVVTDLKRVIAYSTMSQIGYMVMAVSSAAYAAGMFHLMTHAFFKALLFMAAGSVIAAMAGIQDLDRMSGFRRAMPFTFLCMMIGGLALSGVPPFSGFFSKDEIIALLFAREDWHTVLGVLGYLGSFLTAVYTFRMIFRAFYGDPCPEAQELEHGHLFHAEHPTNPMTGEIEDTDVGFPGPEHHIAEREFPMKLAMGALAFLALFGGALQVPEVTDELHAFLEPAFHDSAIYETLEPSTSLTIVGLLIGAAIALTGIFIAWRLYGHPPQRATALQQRFPALHTFFVNKWYFDEAIDFLFVRPAAWTGRFARTTFERLVVDGALVGGATGVVRLSSAAVRRVQTGYLRYYAALLLMGITSLGAYFLIAA